ncbi:hypothetical protein IT575_06720 [bacterium]|nr:hypothetical protein [bacterium]
MSRRYAHGSEERELSLRRSTDGSMLLSLDGRELKLAELQQEAGELSFIWEGRRVSAFVLSNAGGFELWIEGRRMVFRSIEPGADGSEAGAERGGDLVSRMPGKVLALLVEPGAQVHKGQPLLILEAMKMEHEILAPADGVVSAFRKAQGDRVMPGDLLVDFEAST